MQHYAIIYQHLFRCYFCNEFKRSVSHLIRMVRFQLYC